MRYYNSSKKYNMPVVGDEPNILDDNTTSTREIKIECIRFFVNSEISKNVGDNFVIQHADSSTGILNDWYTAKSDKTVRGFTTFSNVIAKRTAAINITPLIISGSWDYDGTKERFVIPILSPIYSNDNIICSLSGKSSTKNSLIINPTSGIIEVSREV
ncbi:hypothetical protein LJB88_02130 [Erysipelotrichaceae bacterium OttesenSCG-928-M19]|nr:hypothetical protein [Erysipelotrichaceae bacterium OttesenSCG-928-M19]